MTVDELITALEKYRGMEVYFQDPRSNDTLLINIIDIHNDYYGIVLKH
jgi:hypothetical protein